MKILYTTNDRRDAQLAADALHGLAANVAVAWAGQVSDAQSWVSENRDLTAIVVESHVQSQSCASLVRYVRGLGMTIPILVLAPDDEKPPVAALKAGATDYVLRSKSHFSHLTAIVNRTLQAQAQSPPLRLLYVGDAALARECLACDRHRIEITEAVPSANGRFQRIPPELLAAEQPLPFDVLLVEHDRPGVHAFAILKDVLARELPIPVIFVVEWDEQIVIPAVKLGAADCVVKSRESLRTLLFRLDRRHSEHLRGRPSTPQSDSEARWHATIERERIGRETAEAALHDTERRHATELAVAAERLSEQQSQYDNRVTQLTAARLAVERKLAEADAAVERLSRARLSDAASYAEQLAERDEAITTGLTEVVRMRDVLEKQLDVAVLALGQARKDRAADAAAAAAQLTRHERELAEADASRQILDQELAAAHAALKMLECRLVETETAVGNAEQRSTDDRLAAEQRVEQLQAAFSARVDQETANREALEQAIGAARKRLSLVEAELVETLSHRQMLESRLTDATSALRDADERAAAERLAAGRESEQRQAEFDAQVAQIIASRQAVEQELALSRNALAASEAGGLEAEQRHVSAMTSAAAQWAERQAELETELTGTRAAHAALERALADAQTRHISEIKIAADQFAERQSEYETRLEQAAAVTGAINRQLHDVQTSLEQVHHEREAEALAAAERQSALDARLSEELQARHAIEETMAATRQDLLEAQATLREVQQARTSEMASASAKLSDQHAEYTTRLAQASAAHAALEEKLAHALRQHVSAMEAAVAQAIEQREHYETRLTEAASALEVVDQQLRDAEATLGHVRQDSAAMALAAAEQLAQRESELDAARTARQTLAQRLDAVEAAFERAEERATGERAATAQQAARQQEEFEAELAREVEARRLVERDLVQTRAAAEQARQAFLDESADLTARLAEVEARLVEQLTQERAEVRRLGDEYASVCRTLDQVRAETEQTIERVTREHSAQLARVETLVAERDGQLQAQAARSIASRQKAEQALASLEADRREAVAARDRQVEQLKSELEDLTRELDATRSHRNALQTEADRVPILTGQLEASRAEHRRRFEQSPVGILRCNPAGVLLDANQALIGALGYRNVTELCAVNFSASVCESADDLRWVIESSRRTPRESIDSIWTRKDGTRLTMRLRAVQVSGDVIEIVAEDLTSLRAVEERLRRAQRMEAVGRLASEVAVTCDNLLRDASQEARQWLAAIGDNTAQRHQGELIVGELTRAASLLRQLSVYGEKQTRALAPVDVNVVLRELEPILKRVAGDDIELVLPKKVAALDVDMDAERVERVLVNVAAYGRSRMPSGGRLVVELARVAVDRSFVTKYPNVRQGAHALIRVTEVRAARRGQWPNVGGERAATPAGATTPDSPGVELGTLQGLIRDCGGHLWMKAEPGGDMEVRIHLPLRSPDKPTAAAHRSSRGRSVGRWFLS